MVVVDVGLGVGGPVGVLTRERLGRSDGREWLVRDCRARPLSRGRRHRQAGRHHRAVAWLASPVRCSSSACSPKVTRAHPAGPSPTRAELRRGRAILPARLGLACAVFEDRRLGLTADDGRLAVLLLCLELAKLVNLAARRGGRKRAGVGPVDARRPDFGLPRLPPSDEDDGLPIQVFEEFGLVDGLKKVIQCLLG